MLFWVIRLIRPNESHPFESLHVLYAEMPSKNIQLSIIYNYNICNHLTLSRSLSIFLLDCGYNMVTNKKSLDVDNRYNIHCMHKSHRTSLKYTCILLLYALRGNINWDTFGTYYIIMCRLAVTFWIGCFEILRIARDSSI